MPYVYILKCSDGSYYVGSTIDLEHRMWEHQNGFYAGYTSTRRPVELVWSADFQTEHDAFLFERQIKGWSRAKKESLIRGDWNSVHQIVKQERKEREAIKKKARPSTSPAKNQAGSAQDAD
jgi:predicted GIY-YIG superfamily endonuclease